MQVKKDKLKIYRNSECSICGCYLCRIQIKVVSKTKEQVITCRDCFLDAKNGLEDLPKGKQNVRT